MTARKPPPGSAGWRSETVAHVVDGDTVDLEVRRPVGELDGFTIEAVGIIRIRLVHLDTPERGEPGYDEAADDLSDWLFEFDKDADGGLRVTTQGRDAFGRYLGDIYAAYDRPDTASDYMVRERDWPVWTG